MSRHGHYVETLATEGMGGRMKMKKGQLVPLKHRLSHFQMRERKERMQARRTVAAQLTGQMNLMRQQMMAFVNMGMIQRWKLRRQIRKQVAA